MGEQICSPIFVVKARGGMMGDAVRHGKTFYAEYGIGLCEKIN